MADHQDDGVALTGDAAPSGRRIAVYGGSFDPPHIAHVMVTAWALSCGDVDEVRIVPTYSHALGKDTRTDFDLRMHLCRLAMAPFHGVVVDDIERDIGGTSRTYNTLHALAERIPGARFRLVVGADILTETDRWYRWDDIVAMAPLLVIGRDGYPDPPGASIHLPNVSSTEIRRRFGSGEDVGDWVPTAVAAAVREAGLYRR